MPVQNIIEVIKQGPQGPSGGGLNYIPITTAGVHTYTRIQLPLGTNIFGVNAPGPVTIRLPDGLLLGTFIIVKDESLNAATNNITIETYLET